jgi:C1A family cysteine protease
MSKPRLRSVKQYGWTPDLPDKRDVFYSVTAPRKLPKSIDLRSKCSPVDDQGNLGSCTGNGIAGVLEYLVNKAGQRPIDISRLFIYYGEREIERTIPQDAGAMIRDGIKVCAKLGACLETLWPYKVSKFAQKPPPKAYADAAKRKIAAYVRITSLNTLRASLADGFPVVFGFAVYESFESDQVARTGFVPMPDTANDAQLGGHCVVAVGYHDESKRVLCRNSWGADWGIGGYFWLPYDYVSDRDLADDFWQIRA